MKTTLVQSSAEVPARLLQQISTGLDHDTDFDIRDLARAMYMSRFTLHRYTTRTTGLSPGRLILKLRLEKALSLLSSHQARVTDIAFKTGFNSVSRFSNAFKRQYGICPNKWGALKGVELIGD